MGKLVPTAPSASSDDIIDDHIDPCALKSCAFPRIKRPCRALDIATKYTIRSIDERSKEWKIPFDLFGDYSSSNPININFNTRQKTDLKESDAR